MADLLNRQASLLSPSTMGTTGSLLQDKPENAVVPDLSKVQVEPTQVSPSVPTTTPEVSPRTPEITQEVTQEVTQEPPREETPLSRHQELRQRRKTLAIEKTHADSKVAQRLRDNRKALEKGQPTLDKDEGIEWSEVPEDTFWAGVRGLNQGVGWLLDLVPTGVLQGVELVDNYLLDDYVDTSKYQYVVQRKMNDRWGTLDSYKTNAVAEIAADVGQAAPTMVTTGGALARYGLNQITAGGTLNQYAAPYALRLGQSLGIDTAAVAAGETAEEIVEEVAGEDSLWGTGANLMTSIFSGTWMQKKFQPSSVLQREAEEVGTTITGTPSTSQEEGSSMAVVRDKLTEFLTGNGITKMLFKNFADEGGNMSAYANELRLMGKSGKAHIRELWNKVLTDEERSQFFANMEMASQLGLKLTPYELLGHESLRPISLSVAKITPQETLKRIDNNLEILDKLLAKDAPELSEMARDQLKETLRGHNVSVEDSVEELKLIMKRRKQDILADIASKEKASDPVLIGEQFKQSVKDYVDQTKVIFGRQFDEAVDKELKVTPKVFSSNLKSSLEELGRGTFTLPAKAGRLVNDLIKAATPVTTKGGVDVYTKVKIGDLMSARTSLNKGLMGLNVNDPLFQKNRQSLFNAIEAIDTTLGTTLPKESQEALMAAKEAWKQHVGIKFGSKEIAKLTTRDSFNNPFYNGQEMLEVLFSGADKETKARAYADFLNVNNEVLGKFATGDEVTTVINTTEAAKLGIKQYVTNQLVSEVAMRSDVPIEGVVQAFMQRNSGILGDLLDEVDFDPGKIIRDVERGISDLQKAEIDLMASKLNLGGSKEGGTFDLNTYLSKTVLENKIESDRLISLINNKERMDSLGYTKEGTQAMFASTLVRDIVGEAPNGRILDTNLRKLLEKAPSKLEELIGKERVEHMRKFLVGHKMTTRIKPSEVRPTSAGSLDRNMAEEMGLGLIPTFVSDRMMIAKRIASAEYVMALRAVKIIGGLKSNGYRKFMSKVLTDPEFFLDVIKFNPNTHDGVKRARLYLAAQGIDTSILNSQEAQEQLNNLEQVHAETEGSPFNNEETLAELLVGGDEETVEISGPITEDDATMMLQRGELTEDDVAFMRNEGKIISTEEPQINKENYGLREDGTKKQRGFLGELKTPEGDLMTEFSFSVDIDGEEILMPAVVPTLTEEEVNHLVTTKEITPEIERKAIEHALERKSEGKSPFWEPEEDEITEDQIRALIRSLSPEERKVLMSKYEQGQPEKIGE